MSYSKLLKWQPKLWPQSSTGFAALKFAASASPVRPILIRHELPQRLNATLA
jgi:hypothetical protein